MSHCTKLICVYSIIWDLPACALVWILCRVHGNKNSNLIFFVVSLFLFVFACVPVYVCMNECVCLCAQAGSGSPTMAAAIQDFQRSESERLNEVKGHLEIALLEKHFLREYAHTALFWAFIFQLNIIA